MGAQVVGVSTDHFLALNAWKKENGSKQLLLSDFRRQMLPAYGGSTRIARSSYAKRAFFIIDKNGTVKFVKVMDNSLDLPERRRGSQALGLGGLSGAGGAVTTRVAGRPPPESAQVEEALAWVCSA